ncbi:gluconate 2-dehydrogenase subunit 3 family protein [Ammoniphilus sp. 3BR4]|uniref:gluconate 2-dehydrogenase subunit 3 family protein n=1 Tax=Ammoniphilus sp. 3BR4 TaxID=3158265 RepID=UPI003465E413
MTSKSHYSSYDVMEQKDHWDDHTQQVVSSRLKNNIGFRFLQDTEVHMLRKICSLLVGDEREEILQFMLHHFDDTLHSSVGEGQRKTGVPKAQVLIRKGLQAIDQASRDLHTVRFIQLDKKAQVQLLIEISESKAVSIPEWDSIPQKELFKKLLTLSKESYYSHPTVWSEIGYGGPAYPRGYVRTQLGQLDPWEAQPDDES